MEGKDGTFPVTKRSIQKTCPMSSQAMLKLIRGMNETMKGRIERLDGRIKGMREVKEQLEVDNRKCFPHSGLDVHGSRVDATIQHQGGGAEVLGVCAREPDQIFIGECDDLAGPGMIRDDDDHDDCDNVMIYHQDNLIQRLETRDSPMEEVAQAQRSLGNEVSWPEMGVVTRGTLTEHCDLATEVPKFDNQLREHVDSRLDSNLTESGSRTSDDLVPVGNLDQLQEGAGQPAVEVVTCSCGLEQVVRKFKRKKKITFKWEIDLEQPWRELVPGLWNSDMGRSRVVTSGKSCPFQNLEMPASWGAGLVRFGRGVQPWVAWYDLGPTGGQVECGVPSPSERRSGWWLGPSGSPDPGGG